MISAFVGVVDQGLVQTSPLSGYPVINLDSGPYGFVSGGQRHAQWPHNYVAVTEGILPAKVMLATSSHEEVRQEYVERGIWFALVYPHRSLKQQWLERLRAMERVDPCTGRLVSLLERCWDEFLESMESQKDCHHEVLQAGVSLKDRIPSIVQAFTEAKQGQVVKEIC